jgi:hypothetical protein
VLDLVADRPPDLVDAVGDALLDGQGHHVGRQAALGAGVEVAARRADGVAGGDDAGAGDPAGLDRFAQRHVQQVAAGLDEQAEVPDRRVPGSQGPLGVDGRP